MLVSVLVYNVATHVIQYAQLVSEHVFDVYFAQVRLLKRHCATKLQDVD